MYIDVQLQFTIQYYPEDLLDNPALYDKHESNYPIRFKKDIMSEEAPPFVAIPHIAFDINEMLYSIVFYEKLLSVGKAS